MILSDLWDDRRTCGWDILKEEKVPPAAFSVTLNGIHLHKPHLKSLAWSPHILKSAPSSIPP